MKDAFVAGCFCRTILLEKRTIIEAFWPKVVACFTLGKIIQLVDN